MISYFRSPGPTCPSKSFTPTDTPTIYLSLVLTQRVIPTSSSPKELAFVLQHLSPSNDPSSPTTTTKTPLPLPPLLPRLWRNPPPTTTTTENIILDMMGGSRGIITRYIASLARTAWARINWPWPCASILIVPGWRSRRPSRGSCIRFVKKGKEGSFDWGFSLDFCLFLFVPLLSSMWPFIIIIVSWRIGVFGLDWAGLGWDIHTGWKFVFIHTLYPGVACHISNNSVCVFFGPVVNDTHLLCLVLLSLLGSFWFIDCCILAIIWVCSALVYYLLSM